MLGLNLFKTQQPSKAIAVVQTAKKLISEHPLTTSKYGYQWSRDVYTNSAQPSFIKKVAAHQGVAFMMTIANVAEFVLNGVFVVGNAASAVAGCVLSGGRNLVLGALGKQSSPSKFVVTHFSTAKDVGSRLGAMVANVAGLFVSARLFVGGRVGALAMAEHWKLKNPEPIVKPSLQFLQQHKKKIYGLGAATVAVAGAYVLRNSLPAMPSISLPAMPSISLPAMPSISWPELPSISLPEMPSWPTWLSSNGGTTEEKPAKPGQTSESNENIQNKLDEAAERLLANSKK